MAIMTVMVLGGIVLIGAIMEGVRREKKNEQRKSDKY